MIDVTCIGEAIVDLVGTKPGVALKDAPQFSKHAGGAPANVAVGLARLGLRSAFAGRVGDDPFGRFLVSELRKHRVHTGGVILDRDHRTRLAFVSVNASGEREFEFWEQRPADEQLRTSDVPLKRLSDSKIIHVSSFLLVREPSRSTVLSLLQKLHRAGATVSFDPNIRASIWKSVAEARRCMLEAISMVSLVRLNKEEAAFLSRNDRVDAAASKLLAAGPAAVVVTMGDRGSYFQTSAGLKGRVKGYVVRPVDTTGCGDAFLAGLLSMLIRMGKKLESMSEQEWTRACAFANAAGALAATKRGAIASMPALSQVRRMVRGGRR